MNNADLVADAERDREAAQLATAAASSTAPPAQAKPRVLFALLAFPILVLLQAFAGVVVTFLVAIGLTIGPDAVDPQKLAALLPTKVYENPWLLVVLGVMTPLVLAFALLLAALSPTAIKDRLALGGLKHMRRPERRGLVYGVAAVGTLAVSEGAMLLIGFFVDVHSVPLQAFATAARTNHPLELAALLFFGVVVAPCGEELFFRGYVQSRLAARFHPAAVVIFTAAAFGVFHLDLVQGSFAFCIGVFLGWTSLHFRSVRPAIVAHAFNNFVSFASARAGYDESEVRFEVQVAILAVCVVVVVGSVAALRRLALKSPEPPPAGAGVSPTS